jgi:predicted dehydrogenase
MWRHQPRTAELLKLVGSGVIGELRLIRSSFSFPIDLADLRLDKKRGGGALFDVGCYGVSTARFFAQGEPTRLSALAHLSAGGVDLSLSATLQFPGGTLAAIDCSFEQPFRCTYELVGSHGVIEVPDAYLPPEKGKPTALLRTSDPNGGAGKIETITFDASDQYGAMVDAFATSVTAGSLVAPAEDGLAQMAVLDRIKSAVAQKEVC